VEFRRLAAQDDRSTFCCGNEDLDQFFRRYAGQNQFRHQIGVTYVLVDSDGIAAYVTVSTRSLMLPKEQRGSLPGYELPVVLIARMGVDLRARGLGLGKRLVRECCVISVSLADQVGCVGLVTDAKVDAIEFYRKVGFQPIGDADQDGTQRHLLPMRAYKALVIGSPVAPST
jgi:GNAT superfamily N-acetyltransferase